MLCSSKRSWATPVVLMLYDDNGADQWSVKSLNFDIDTFKMLLLPTTVQWFDFNL